MGRYLVRSLLRAVPILLGITTITFVLMWLIPGDASQAFADPKTGAIDPAVIQAVRRQWGLDASPYAQYGRYLWNVVRGDLGFSQITNERVLDALRARFPATAKLALTAILLSSGVGMSVGIFTAARRGSLFDTVGTLVSLFSVAVPAFWLGLIFMWLFAVKWPVFPPTGYGHGEWSYLILPAATLGLASAGSIARLTRSAMLDAINADYVRTARAKGAPERAVIGRHVLRNALIPVVTLIGIDLGGLIAGTVIIETVFAWPGVGRLFVQAVLQRNLLMVQGCVLFFASVFIVMSLLVDLAYGLLDPRIRYD